MINLQVINSSKCQGCTVCCTVMGVEELGKPYHRSCEHIGKIKNNGCSIYKNHPTSCKDFTCFHIYGWQKLRPDKSGYMITASKIEGNLSLDIYESTIDHKIIEKNWSATKAEIENHWKGCLDSKIEIYDLIRYFPYNKNHNIGTRYHSSPKYGSIDTFKLDTYFVKSRGCNKLFVLVDLKDDPKENCRAEDFVSYPILNNPLKLKVDSKRILNQAISKVRI